MLGARRKLHYSGLLLPVSENCGRAAARTGTGVLARAREVCVSLGKSAGEKSAQCPQNFLGP